MESFNEVGRLSPTLRGQRAIGRARMYEAELNRLLTAPQMFRLRQIGLQAQGVNAFNEPEVVAELKLTAQQREKFRMIEEETHFAWMRASRPSNGSADESIPQDKLPNERLLAVLTDEQLRRWKEMTGEPLTSGLTTFLSPSMRSHRPQENTD